MCTKSEQSEHPAIVQTSCGKVKGYEKDSVLVFKGIPYARAKRFMRPQATASWDTIMDCTEFGDIAPQLDPRPASIYNPADTARTMSEDCLNLNIWTSMRADESPRPVMVWLHGGGFRYGSSHQNRAVDGTYLADKENVVVVTLNHRLGVLGFLDLSAYGDKYEHTGNLGLLDIMSAIWWIRDNIAAFGGDPDNITLFGEGSGGVKVLMLLAMPIAKGSFQKAIIQSGMIDGMGLTSIQSRQLTARIMEEAGAATPEELAQMPFEKLDSAATRAIAAIQKEDPKRRLTDKVCLAPVSHTRLLPQPIYSDSAIFASADVPIIIGSNLSDLIDFDLDPDSITLRRENIHHFTQSEIDSRMKEKFGNLSEKVKHEYAFAYPDRIPAEALVTDTHVRSYVMRMAHLLAKRGSAPVYVYRFSWASPLHDGYTLSFRSSEIPFVFGNYNKAEYSLAGGNESRRLSRIMTRCWASFARSGNPNNSITPFWRRINLGEGHTMVFDSDVHLEGYQDLELVRLLHPENVKDIKLTERAK